MRNLWRGAVLLMVAVQATLAAISLYQAAVTVAGRFASRRPIASPQPAADRPRILAVVCARDEERVISGLLADLRLQTYPADRFDVLVVAHNCTDRTARVAREAGARVIEAGGPPGKASALSAGVGIWSEWPYVAVFDADSRIPPEFLAEASARLGEDVCVQVETVPDAVAGTVAAGYGLGRRARSALWWRPREALGLSVTINGTGYLIAVPVLREQIGRMRSVTEDLELTARLVAGGRRVRYLSTTWVSVEEPLRLGSSMRQRTRWARGHLRVVHAEWLGLARRALGGDLRALDMAIYLAVPTRLLTRTAVTGSLLVAAAGLPFALPLWLVLPAVGGEWGLPLAVGVRDDLVSINGAGLRLAFRNGVLSLLWFPIGLWALVTARSTAWHSMPRATAEETDVPTPF